MFNAAIAYNVWHTTSHRPIWNFMAYYGAEMLLEIARFWASIATYNGDSRFSLRNFAGVFMGPDEFSTPSTPNREKPFYYCWGGGGGARTTTPITNVMARVGCCIGPHQVLTLLDEKRPPGTDPKMLDQINDEELVPVGPNQPAACSFAFHD